MKKFALKILLLSGIVGGIVYLYLRFSYVFIEREMGPTTASMLYKSFGQADTTKFDLVILGSSRTHAAINPDVASIPSYNFSFEGETFNQFYYKLRYLEELNKTPKYVILGTEYFQFAWFLDDLNSLYRPFFPKAYFDDYKDSIFPDIIGYKNRKNTAFNHFMSKKFSNTFFPFINGVMNYVTGGTPKNNIYISHNGQYISHASANPNDSIVYDYRKNRLLERYFYEIIDYCKQKNIKLWLVMTPALSNTLKYYPSEVVQSYNELITSMADNKNIFFYNYSTDTSYSIQDFKDVSHLNVGAADRFTRKLFARMQQALQMH
jgi:hypothetical protein